MTRFQIIQGAINHEQLRDKPDEDYIRILKEKQEAPNGKEIYK